MIGNVTRNTIAIVLAGGKGERLTPLTINKPKPCVPFGAKYKIVDFVLSNMFNSGIKKVYVLTQYKAHALNKHIKSSWSKWMGLGEFYDTISPETSSDSEEWFQGTADAIYQFLNFIESTDAEYVAIFGGDHIYKMDVSQMLASHLLNRADITIAALEVTMEEAKRFGVFSVDDDFRITDFAEKPKKPVPIPDRDTCFASMGNYIFSTRKLIEVLKEGKKKHADLDFGQHVIPMMLAAGDRVYAYNFMDNLIPGMKPEEKGYWRDVGTIDSYYAANMDLLEPVPPLNLYQRDWPIRNYNGQNPPARIVTGKLGNNGRLIDSMLGSGTVVSGGTVMHSILFSKVYVDENAVVEDSILFDGVHIGSNAHLKRCIVDKHVQIPPGESIGINAADDLARFTISDLGITVVPKYYMF